MCCSFLLFCICLLFLLLYKSFLAKYTLNLNRLWAQATLKCEKGYYKVFLCKDYFDSCNVQNTCLTKRKRNMASSMEYKELVEKLEGPDDWAKWKWHMKMVFRSHGLETIVEGSRVCPVLPAEVNDQQRNELTEWQKDDARAASFLAGAVNRQIAELVLTCVHAKEIWEKLCARFERSSTQRLNMLIESFFRAKRDEKKDVSMYTCRKIAKVIR